MTIPDTITGLPVTSIGGEAFDDCGSLTTVMLPDSVTNIAAEAFADCTGLTGVFLQGNAPTVGASAFVDDDATVYYLAGTTGWGPTFGELATSLWDPLAQAAYTVTNGAIIITAYTGLGGDVTIPDTITGLPVTSIGDEAFASCTNLASVVAFGNEYPQQNSFSVFGLLQRPRMDELSNPFLPGCHALRRGSGSWPRPLKLCLADLPAATHIAHQRALGNVLAIRSSTVPAPCSAPRAIAWASAARNWQVNRLRRRSRSAQSGPRRLPGGGCEAVCEVSHCLSTHLYPVLVEDGHEHHVLEDTPLSHPLAQ